VIRAADDRRNASIMISISMMCSSTGAHVGWTMNTSVPRMFSSIWNETSVSGKRRRRHWPIGNPRWCAISRASSGWAVPENNFSSPYPAGLSIVSCHQREYRVWGTVLENLSPPSRSALRRDSLRLPLFTDWLG
jgi:hypothetical protein